MFILPLIFLVCSVSCAAVPRSTGPTVTFNHGTFQGGTNGTVDHFLGIPYAQPPLGPLRFNKPLAPLALSGKQDASTYGHSCFPQAYTLPGIKDLNYTALEGFVAASTPSEDCLNLNVFRPTGISSTSKLPVVVWFFGGAFETGDASSYNPTNIVSRSQTLNEPIIFIAVNYRLNAFGFLGGKEVVSAGVANLGIHDQSSALSWIQSEITALGGDPTKVTLWGQSSGGVSVVTQMVLNANVAKPPFRAGVIHSTFTPLMVPTDGAVMQYYHDGLVAATGCSSAANTLDCLRGVPATAIIDYVNTTPAQFNPYGINFTWTLSMDGTMFKKTLKESIRAGEYAKIPLIGGQVDDEGTLFSLYSQNITTDAAFNPYIAAEFLPNATSAEVAELASHYSSNPAAGSPFDSGSDSALTPVFKRIAAIQGDYYFQSGRREAFSYFKRTTKLWSFLWKREKDLKYLGSVHGGDLPEFYSTASSDYVATDALVNFINNMDPNHPKGSTAKSGLSSITWPSYGTSEQMLLFSDNVTESYTTIADNYRSDGINAIIALQKKYGQ